MMNPMSPLMRLVRGRDAVSDQPEAPSTAGERCRQIGRLLRGTVNSREQDAVMRLIEIEPQATLKELAQTGLLRAVLDGVNDSATRDRFLHLLFSCADDATLRTVVTYTSTFEGPGTGRLREQISAHLNRNGGSVLERAARPGSCVAAAPAVPLRGAFNRGAVSPGSARAQEIKRLVSGWVSARDQRAVVDLMTTADNPRALLSILASTGDLRRVLNEVTDEGPRDRLVALLLKADEPTLRVVLSYSEPFESPAVYRLREQLAGALRG